MPPVNPARYIAPLEIVPDGEYVAIAASTTKSLGAGGGALGDCLFGLLIVPTVVAVGAPGITLTDGSGSAITILLNGTLASIVPVWVPLNLVSTGGAWKVITGSGVTVVAVGKFT